MASKTERAQIDLIVNGQTANKSLRDLEAAARKAKSEIRGLASNDARFQELTGKIQNVNKAIDETRVKAGMAKSSWDKMKDSIKTTFIGNLGANLATLGLQKVAGYFTDSFRAAQNLSDQLTDIQRLAGLSAAEARELNHELSTIDTRTSMGDLREIAKVGGQFGVAKDQMLEFVKATDMVSVSLRDEFGSTEQAATQMSKLRNILVDVKSDNIGQDIKFISNAIVELANSGVATGPVVSDFAQRIGGVGLQVGLTSGQVLGLSATLQELGVSQERGGTAVVRILQKMLTETQAFAEIAGMDLKSFKKLLNDDIYGAFVKVMEGSKKLGPNATQLASIIKDLEVQGAGASEVFAKLGSNTTLLGEKVELAGGALSKTSAITDAYALKNENLAGTVEQIEKSWNKLTANPAMVQFFSVGMGLISAMIDGLDRLIKIIPGITGNYQAFVEGQLEDVADGLMRQQEIEKSAYAEQLAAFKSKLKGMNEADLAYQQASLKLQMEASVRELNLLKERGDLTGFLTELKYAKLIKAQQSAIDNELKQRELAESTKDRISQDELEKQEKAAIKAAKKKAAELKRELDEEFKLIDKYWDDRIAIAQKNLDNEQKLILEAGKEKWEELKKYYENEVTAALDMAVLKAETETEIYEAEKNRLIQVTLDKQAILKEGSNQWLALEAKLNADLQQLENRRIDTQVSRIKEYANNVSSVTSKLNSYFQSIYQNDLNSYNKNLNSKKAALKDQLDTGMISAIEYNNQMISLDAEAAEKNRQMQVQQAMSIKKFALFEATIKAALAWVEAYINPLKIPGAIAATAELAIIEATPLPQFYSGGWLPNSANDKNAYPIIAHANEYMINAQSARDPYVMNTIQMIEASRNTGKTVMEIAGNNNSTGPIQISIPEMLAFKDAVATFTQMIKAGIPAYLIMGERELLDMEKVNKRIIERGENGLGRSATEDLSLSSGLENISKANKSQKSMKFF
ncbi:MAG: phage tail tape measure protein [Bacteroidia bacterium]|jgi:TP901 family phage tail tape measure protein